MISNTNSLHLSLCLARIRCWTKRIDSSSTRVRRTTERERERLDRFLVLSSRCTRLKRENHELRPAVVVLVVLPINNTSNCYVRWCEQVKKPWPKNIRRRKRVRRESPMTIVCSTNKSMPWRHPKDIWRVNSQIWPIKSLSSDESQRIRPSILFENFILVFFSAVHPPRSASKERSLQLNG